MIDTCQIWLEDAEKTQFAGSSLSKSLYGTTDIYLIGELGAGKTTFLDGFSSGLGISTALQSPTYALEHRYQTAQNEDFIHIDLYRLQPAQAKELLEQSNDHTGIRCIEWAQRLDLVLKEGIHIYLDDDADSQGRKLRIEFYDLPLPTNEQIAQWQKDVALPPHIVAHCNAVATLCTEIAEKLIQSGGIVRTQALVQSAKLHDLFRFMDFQLGAAHDPALHEQEDPKEWVKWREHFAGMHHEESCATFLREQKFPELASIVATHGTINPPEETGTIEQKILYYADKRIMNDKQVTAEERFEDLVQRYEGGEWTDKRKESYEKTKAIEKELEIDQNILSS